MMWKHGCINNSVRKKILNRDIGEHRLIPVALTFLFNANQELPFPFYCVRYPQHRAGYWEAALGRYSE